VESSLSEALIYYQRFSRMLVAECGHALAVQRAPEIAQLHESGTSGLSGIRTCNSRVGANTAVAPLFIGARPAYLAAMKILTQCDRVDGEIPRRARARIASSANAARLVKLRVATTNRGAAPGSSGRRVGGASVFPLLALEVSTRLDRWTRSDT
jgi:hypothetical protein